MHNSGVENMKKNTIYWLGSVALLLAVVVQGNAVAQEEENETEKARPRMPDLFLTVEQRRILEALRQGVLDAEKLEEESFVPVVLREELLEKIDEKPERSGEIKLDAFIRHKKSGKRFLWLNDKSYDLDKDKALIERSNYLRIEDSDNSLAGVDGVSRVRFDIKVGQSINETGLVNESLPIIRKNQ